MNYLAAGWGFAGVVLLLSSAIERLSQVALACLNQPLFWYHWAALLLSVSFLGFFEGYRGFQQAFAPRVVARALYLSKHATLVQALFAPLFCMAYFYTTAKRQRVSFILTFAIVLMVQLVHMLDQPWRGILDVGVVVGLIWGLISIFCFVAQALFSNNFSQDPELPEQPSPKNI